MSQLSSTVHLDTALLPTAAREDFHFWRAHLEPLLEVKAGIVRALMDLAGRIGIPFRTVRKKYYAARKRGVIALVDRRLAGPLHWKTTPGKGRISAEDIELVRRYCGENQRSSESACKQLRRDFIAGRVKTVTPIHAVTRMPRGWSTRNLMRHAPEDFALKSARIGRTAAASERPLVYTTRKGLWVGSHYMFDDMWHDFFVNTFAENQAGRPLELFSHDLYSARKVRWGVRVRTRTADGKYNQLGEQMTRMILAATLYLDGYSPRGTKLLAEHGTAAISEAVERALRDLSMVDGKSLITVSRSGMTGAQAHAGQYPGLSKGNFRHKASLESSNNLTHNVFADLPGQTGKDVEHRPEGLDGGPARMIKTMMPDGTVRTEFREAGLLHHNAALLAARAQLPAERAALLKFPLLELSEFHGVAAEKYAAMENDPDHELSNWAECGHTVQELLIGGQWRPLHEIVTTDAQAEFLERFLADGTMKSRPRKMTRREVWDLGAGDLIRLPGHGVVAILGDDLAVERKVIGNRFEFADAEVGPGTHRFEAVCVTPHGERMRLSDRETYETFVNPFAPDTLFVRRADGSYLGECARDTAPSRTDEEAIRRKMGEVAKAESDLLQPLRITHMAAAREKKARHEHNAQVITEATKDRDRADLGRFARGTEGGRKKVTDAELDSLGGADVPRDFAAPEAGLSAGGDDSRDSVFDL